jgi:hypothetical protein
VAGVVEEKDVRENEYGIYPVIVVKLNDGRRVQVSAFETVLRNRLAERDPKIGERVGILYLGLAQSKRPGRKDYHNFNVITDTSGREVSFTGLRTEGEDDASTESSSTTGEPGRNEAPDLPEPEDWTSPDDADLP